MESKYTPFTGGVSPVAGDTLVQLQLSNGNAPIEKAETFTWGKVGRGSTYPHITGYRIATQEEFDEYQEKKARRRAVLSTESNETNKKTTEGNS